MRGPRLICKTEKTEEVVYLQKNMKKEEFQRLKSIAEKNSILAVWDKNGIEKLFHINQLFWGVD